MITLVQLYQYSHVCENVITSATLLGKDISTIACSARSAVWLTTIHTGKNYQKVLTHTTVKSTSAVSLISALKYMHIPFDITSISHENKRIHIIYSSYLGFTFMLETKHKSLISKEKGSFTSLEVKNFSTYFSSLMQNQKQNIQEMQPNKQR